MIRIHVEVDFDSICLGNKQVEAKYHAVQSNTTTNLFKSEESQNLC